MILAIGSKFIGKVGAMTVKDKQLLYTSPTAHSHPHYTLKKYAFYNKMYILRIISGFL